MYYSVNKIILYPYNLVTSDPQWSMTRIYLHHNMICCCVPHNSQGHTETGLGFEVSSERLEKPKIELMNPGLQGEWLYHYTMEASAI